MRPILDRLPLILLFVSIAAALFAYGAATERYRLFPRENISDAVKTFRTVIENRKDRGRYQGFSAVALDDVTTPAIEFLGSDSLEESVLIYGGRFQYREYCPGHGCLAIVVSPAGEVVHAYPYRPKAIYAARSEGTSYEYEENLFSTVRDIYPVGIQRYRNGDLLVTFHQNNTFPYGGGIARVDPEGYPVWFRHDYSHHWPTLTDDEVALVPSLRLGSGPVELVLGGERFTRDCDGSFLHDVVDVLDGDGNLIEQIGVLDAIGDSPHRGILAETYRNCDPTHLNYIDTIGDDVGGLHDLDPGDLVLSLRNLSAFIILDGQTHRLKRLVRGTFLRQHSVQHLEGSRFLMFDNIGGDAVGGPSRLLMVDLATGRETTIFPRPDTPDSVRGLLSISGGNIDISPDRLRAIVAFSGEGVAVEVRISDGAALNVIRSLHDVSDLDQFPEQRLTRAAIFSLCGVDYLDDQATTYVR